MVQIPEPAGSGIPVSDPPETFSFRHTWIGRRLPSTISLEKNAGLWCLRIRVVVSHFEDMVSSTYKWGKNLVSGSFSLVFGVRRLCRGLRGWFFLKSLPLNLSKNGLSWDPGPITLAKRTCISWKVVFWGYIVIPSHFSIFEPFWPDFKCISWCFTSFWPYRGRPRSSGADFF